MFNVQINRFYLAALLVSRYACKKDTSSQDSQPLLIALGSCPITSLLIRRPKSISRMSFLLSLPEILCNEVLSQWICLDDVQNIDNAFCNTIDRCLLMDLFQTSEFAVRFETKSCDVIMDWILLRDIKLQNLYLQFNNPEFILSCMDVNTSRVTEIKFELSFISSRRLTEDSLICLINTCPMLTSLNVEAFGHDSIAEIKPEILEQLTTFIYTGGFSVYPDQVINLITTSCPNLTTLGFLVPDLSNATTEVITFLQTSTATDKLKIISFHGPFVNTKVINTIATHCSQLTELNLSGNVTAVPLQDTTVLINNYSNLQRLTACMTTYEYIYTRQFNSATNNLSVTFNQAFSYSTPDINTKRKAIVLTILNESAENAESFFEIVTNFHSIKLSYAKTNTNVVSIANIILHNPKLVEFGFLDATSELRVAMLLQRCQSLCVLTINGNLLPKTTNVQIRYNVLFSTPKNLTTVVLQNNHEVTADIVWDILQQNPSIHTLQICHCEALDVIELWRMCMEESRNVRFIV